MVQVNVNINVNVKVRLPKSTIAFLTSSPCPSKVVRLAGYRLVKQNLHPTYILHALEYSSQHFMIGHLLGCQHVNVYYQEKRVSQSQTKEDPENSVDTAFLLRTVFMICTRPQSKKETLSIYPAPAPEPTSVFGRHSHRVEMNLG